MTCLVIAPHADDETLGMGATIAKLAASQDDVVVAVMTGHGGGVHPLGPETLWERVRTEAKIACKILGVRDLLFRDLPTVLVPDLPIHVINKTVQELLETVKPTRVFVPHPSDLHKDHGALTYATMVALRAYLPLGRPIKLIASYEVPTETHLHMPGTATAFDPNYWIDVGDHIEKKLEAWSTYASQHQNNMTPRHPEVLRALARWRGAQIGVHYAEAFQIIRQCDH